MNTINSLEITCKVEINISLSHSVCLGAFSQLVPLLWEEVAAFPKVDVLRWLEQFLYGISKIPYYMPTLCHILLKCEHADKNLHLMILTHI